MPLLYIPDEDRFFLWGEDLSCRELPLLAIGGEPASVELVTPDGRRNVEGLFLPLLATAAQLAVVSTATLEALPASIASWALASKFGLELVSAERVLPTVLRCSDRNEARWTAAITTAADAAMVAAIARSMPPAAHAIPVGDDTSVDVWAPEALLQRYLDAVADALVRQANVDRSSIQTSKIVSPKGRLPIGVTWEQRWRTALEVADRVFEGEGLAESSVLEDLEQWVLPAFGPHDNLRACFQLELPASDGGPFLLRFFLQSLSDSSLLVPASAMWERGVASLDGFEPLLRPPDKSLLEALTRASRLFQPLERALKIAKPGLLELEATTAWAFLGDGAAALGAAGFGVIVPEELTQAGQHRLRLRMHVGSHTKRTLAAPGSAGLKMDELLAVSWEAAMGDQVLTARELLELARQKSPLVLFRGAWVAIDPRELAEIRAHIADGPSRMTMREAVRAVLAGEIRQGPLTVTVSAIGDFAEVLGRLRQSAASDIAVPEGLCATLRPYQLRGLSWLWTMGTLGLGACLADDMGLGKTIQLLAWLLLRNSQSTRDRRPALLIAPTSVVGNWEREIERFAPSILVTQHYGASRARETKDFPKFAGALVVTTYGLLRRDAELLSKVKWSTVVLDEAQNIKNASSSTARAARTLHASHRFALTGTPVENRLSELWSILEFANPGLLGPIEGFRREFAAPIERYGNAKIAEHLRRIVGPFLLRRLKSDPKVIQDLPEKNEMKVVCTLTREQAKLYQAVVDGEMKRIERADGIARRGRVLALLMYLKQICNHPAQYLAEKGPLAKRSGKLARITEMLEEALAEGDKALVFTQFREMGDRLVAHLSATLRCEVVFLHGGTPRKARDAMVQRFQEDPRGPKVFVLSVKAGGTGLNLTAANHVFHYDRWWNPAVEDQATDRAFRIGQQRTVQVHKFLCAGTIEEKVDRMLEQKRELASKIVGAGEKWITELGNRELYELFALSHDPMADDELETEDKPAKPALPRRRPSRTRRSEASQ